LISAFPGLGPTGFPSGSPNRLSCRFVVDPIEQNHKNSKLF
jgi:hypothetical protein